MLHAPKTRLDQALVGRGLVPTRSQAESYIRLGKVTVGGRIVTKPGELVRPDSEIVLRAGEMYVSRAGLKLASVAQKLQLQFAGKVVLDVGSSTGGFTDFALKHGAQKVVAVDVGSDQLHPSLRADPRVELYEQTDIRQVFLTSGPHQATPAVHAPNAVHLDRAPDIIVIDVSFISLRDILSHIARLCASQTRVVAMVKPQFEAGRDQVNKGIIKNDRTRRDILKQFENWVLTNFIIQNKADSDVAGAKGNLERFYLLQKSA